MTANEGELRAAIPEPETSVHDRPAPLQPAPELSSRWVWTFAVFAVVSVVTVLVARLFGPSDMHDQTQPKTIAYTTDLVLHPERWALPKIHDGVPATKPPLYNWLAAPVVWLTDGRYEWAHKVPSMAAFVLLAVGVRRLGARLDPGGATGPIAVICLAGNYAMFKLSYLARPDTILCLWMFVGWWAATVLVMSQSRHRLGWQLVLWVSVGLAGLAKGPPALVLPVFIIVLSIANRRELVSDGPDSAKRRVPQWLTAVGRGLLRTGAAWGLLLAIGIVGTWFYAAYRANPEHVVRTMIQDEVIDRALGHREAGKNDGWLDWIRTVGNMPLYFLTRFAPWSLLFITAVVDLRSRPYPGKVCGLPSRAGGVESTDEPGPRGWVLSSAIWPIVVVAFFTLPVDKRADYIAPAFAPAAVLTAYWLTQLGWQLARRMPGGVVRLAAVVIIGQVVFNQGFGYAARYRLGDSITEFARQVRVIMTAKPMPVVFYRCGPSPVQAMLQRSQRDTSNEVRAALAEGREFWLVTTPREVEDLSYSDESSEGWSFEVMAQSKMAQGSPDGPEFCYQLLRMAPPSTTPTEPSTSDATTGPDGTTDPDGDAGPGG